MTSNSGPVIELDSEGGKQLHTQVDYLRAAGPAVRVHLPEGVDAWAVTRGTIVKQLLTSPHVSKNPRTSWPGYVPGTIAWLAAWVDVQSMFTSDGVDHQRLKQLIGKAFTARRVEALRPDVVALVDSLLDDMTNCATTTVDLRATFAYQVPTGVICSLFGVPAEQRPEMLRCIDAVLITKATQEEAAAVGRDLYAAMAKPIDTKRRDPGEDMTSLLLAAHDQDGDQLSENELISTLILMIGAGSETAVNLIGSATRELLTHPDQLRTVLDDPSRWNDVIEETLRHSPPIMYLPLRYATADLDLGDGCVIPAGDAILLCFGGHGGDSAVHESPTAFDIDRETKEHLAFGHGIHFCLGAPLARLEAAVALPRLFDRFPHLSLAVDADQLQPQRSFIALGNEALPVNLKLQP
jgi:2-hydroxy-5-methyl-1-naphthoate 7-hydroxylase